VGESVARVIDKLERLGHLPRQVPERLPSGDELQQLRAEARELPRLQVGQRELSDIFMLAAGALSPLDGFIGRDDYESVIEHGRLASGIPFTIPIVLRTEEVPSASRLALFCGDKPVGILSITDAYEAEHLREARAVYGTEDDAHPGVRVSIVPGNSAQTMDALRSHRAELGVVGGFAAAPEIEAVGRSPETSSRWLDRDPAFRSST